MEDKVITMQDWLKLVEFGDQCQRDKGKVLDSMELARRPGCKQAVGGYKKLSDLSDFRFFSLGPLYVDCGIPFDIIEEFRATLQKGGDNYDGPRVVLEFKNPLFRGLKEWCNVLEGVWLGPEGYDKLIRFVTTQTIRQKDTGQFWTFKHFELAIPDPMVIDRSEYNPNDPEKRAVIGLFLPSGNRYRLNPGVVGNYPPLNLIRYSPDPEVVKEAQIMLSVG